MSFIKGARRGPWETCTTKPERVHSNAQPSLLPFPSTLPHLCSLSPPPPLALLLVFSPPTPPQHRHHDTPRTPDHLRPSPPPLLATLPGAKKKGPVMFFLSSPCSHAHSCCVCLTCVCVCVCDRPTESRHLPYLKAKVSRTLKKKKKKT